MSWNKVSDASEYRIYGSKCGHSYKLLKKVSAKTTNWTKTGLTKGTAYRFYIAAYDKNGRLVKSDAAHIATLGGKFANPGKISVNKTTVSVKTGKTSTLKATIKVAATKKYLRHTSDVRYKSSNTAIATVNKNGKIKGIKKGSCYVYCYTQNGLYKRVKITVK